MGKKLDLFTGFSKIWDGRKKGDPVDDQEIPEKDRQLYLDPANVMAVVPRYKYVENIVKIMQPNLGKVPEFDFTPDSIEPIASRYSVDYLKKILILVTKTDSESITFMMKRNHPLVVSCDEMDFILAPRVPQPDQEDLFPTLLTEDAMKKAKPVSQAMNDLLISLKKSKIDDKDLLEIKQFIIAKVL